MAAENGFNRARITLRPAELGGVDVFLRDAGAGLAATVVADNPHAAHLLEGAAADLRRHLASSGIELTSLSISVGGEAADAERGGAEGGEAAGGASRADGSDIAAPAAPEPTKTIQLGGGVLIDVLA
jgi:flagellar hook-length control protein FliK